MKTLSLELQFALHDFLVQLINARSMSAIYDAQDKAEQLVRQIEAEYESQT